MSSSDLPTVFAHRTREVLAAHPELAHSWSEDEAREVWTLDIPAQTKEGFDVAVEVSYDFAIVYTHGAHVHFDRSGNTDELVEEILELVRDLLSPDMRVRERRAGNSGYRWYIEAFDGRNWTIEHVTGLLFWNYVGMRSERIFQNQALPGRLGSA